MASALQVRTLLGPALTEPSCVSVFVCVCLLLSRHVKANQSNLQFASCTRDVFCAADSDYVFPRRAALCRTAAAAQKEKGLDLVT